MKIRLIFALCMIAVMQQAAYAQDAISFPEPSQLEPTTYISKFGVLHATGMHQGVGNCPSAAVSFSQSTSAEVTLWACSDINPSSSAGCLSKVAFTGDNVDGLRIHSGAPYLVPELTSAETSGESELTIHCTGASIGGTGGGAVSVSSWSDVESVMRANDLPATSGADSATASVDLAIVLADDFVMDTESETTFQINLPVGGGDNPRISIDLGAHLITNLAKTTLTINAGNVNGTCGSPADYYIGTEGCQGLAHDYDIEVFNGSIANRDDSCDATPNDPCGRAGIEFINFDRLIDGSVMYGGRVPRIDVKCGVDTDWTTGTGFHQLQLSGDACIKFEPIIQQLSVLGGQYDSRVAILMDEWDAAGRGSGPTLAVISFNNSRYTMTSSCSTCEDKGLFDINEEMDSATGDGALIVRGSRIFGFLGNLMGGVLDVDALVSWNGSGPCGGSALGANSYFINNGNSATPFLSGFVKVTGVMCSRGWVRSSAIKSLKTVAHLHESSNGLPGFLQSDTDLSPTVRFPVLDASVGGEIDAFEAQFFVSPRVDSSDIEYSDMLDPEIVSGGVLTNTDSYARVELWIDGFYQVVGSTPTVTQSKTGSYLFDDAILESHLKSVDTPADEECLTFEATGGDFQWQTCGGAGGGTVDDLTADTGGTTTGANVSVLGDASGIDTARSGDTITVSFDPSEVTAFEAADAAITKSDVAESVSALWGFSPSGLGGLTDYDIEIGDTDGSPTYGVARFGDSTIGRTSFSGGSLDLGGAVVINNVGAPEGTPGIEFAVVEGGSTLRMVVPEGGSGNATAMFRSMTLGGTMTLDNAVVTCDHWTSFNGNIDCDTSATGPDLFVMDDIEVEGTIFAHETINFEGATADGNQVIVQTGADPVSDVTITLPTSTGTLATTAQFSTLTIDTAAPVDGSDACTEGDSWLDHTANKIYYCVDTSTDDWFGVALTDTP